MPPSETLQVGEAFEGFSVQTWPDTKGNLRSWDPDAPWGIHQIRTVKTIIEIIPRPPIETEAQTVADKITKRLKPKQVLIDGKLFNEDNTIIGKLFSPGMFYVAEE